MKATKGLMAALLLITLWAAIVLSHIWLSHDLGTRPGLCEEGCWWRLNVLIGMAAICLIYFGLSLFAWRQFRRREIMHTLVWTLASYIALFFVVYRPLIFGMEGLDAWYVR